MYGTLNHFDNQRPVTDEIVQICNQMRYQIEAAMNAKYPIWEPTFYCQRYTVLSCFLGALYSRVARGEPKSKEWKAKTDWSNRYSGRGSLH